MLHNKSIGRLALLFLSAIVFLSSIYGTGSNEFAVPPPLPPSFWVRRLVTR